jgi:hypothetical protein
MLAEQHRRLGYPRVPQAGNYQPQLGKLARHLIEQPGFGKLQLRAGVAMGLVKDDGQPALQAFGVEAHGARVGRMKVLHFGRHHHALQAEILLRDA